jgi:hypothetical protein
MADGTSKSMDDTMGEVFDRIQGEEKAARESARAEVAEPDSGAGEGTPEVPAGSPEPEAPADGADTRVRNPDGTFAKAPLVKAPDLPKPDKTVAKPVDPKAAPVAGKPAAPPSRAVAAPQAGAPAAPNTDQNPTGLAGVNPPAGWSAAAKAAWATLPPVAQAAIAKREQEVSQGFSQYEGIGKALAPVNQQLAMRGIPPQQYVNQMVQLDIALQNPATKMQAFQYLAQTYGIQLPTNSQADAGASIPQGHPDPTIAALQQQIGQLTSHINSEQAQRAQYAAFEQQQTQRQANTEVEAFRNDPANEFFDLVRDDVRGVFERAAVLNQKAPTLKEAYEQAVWANAQTRPVMLARQTQKIQDDQVKAASEAAAKARKSQAPNVRGTNGATPASGPKRPIEEEMAEVYDRMHAAG